MNGPDAVHLDTTGVAASEREEFIRAAVAHAVVPVDLEYRQGEGQTIDMRLDAADLGPVSLQSMRMSAIASRRTPRLARDHSPPSLFVIVKRAGSSAVFQDGRETVVGPGDLVLVRSTQPSLVLADEPSQQDCLQIPLQELALPELMLRRALALRLGPELPLAGVLAEFVDSLTTVKDVGPAEAQHLGHVAVDLVRGLVTTALAGPRQALDHPDADLTLRLVEYLHAHWPEQEGVADRLDPAQLITTRQLYQLLVARGTTFDGPLG